MKLLGVYAGIILFLTHEICIHPSGDSDSAEEAGDHEDEEDKNIEADPACDMAEDGPMMPADLERNDFEENDEGESSETEDEQMEDYEGPDDLGFEEPKSSTDQADAGSGHPRTKLYHWSPEWIQLRQHGEHLLSLPDIAGAGLGRHPAKSFWSSRYPGFPIRTCSWSDTRSPLKCLIACIKRLIKIFLDQAKPANADVWHAQLHDLSQISC